jgi:predicted amidohydrolase YtcJ
MASATQSGILAFMKCLVFILSVAVISAQAQHVDLLIRGGHIVTLNPASGQETAESLAVSGGRIVAIGSDAELKKLTADRVITLHGELVIPGFIEGHGHFMGVGEMKTRLNLRNARNWDEIIAMVHAAALEAKPGEWILGGGWHQSKWDKLPLPNVQGFPVEAELSKAAPNNPVWLTHASFHAAMLNAAALNAAGITSATPDPAGGKILHDAQGKPTGLLNETAQALVSPAYQAYQDKKTQAEREAEARREVVLAANDCLQKGITTFEDAGSSLRTVDLFRQLAREGNLPLRLWVMLRIPTAEVLSKARDYKTIGYGDNHLTVRALKRVMDGALGSRGAWFLEPYSDMPSTSGLNTQDLGDLRRVADFAIQNGFQLCVHAIGDRANREALNLYESEFQAHPDKTGLRWRIEHAQHLDPADIPRFGKLGVIPAMQGIHCTSDAGFVITRLGQKRAADGAYAWRKLVDSGAVMGNGTDAPVEDVDPIASFYATVTRKTKDGTAFFPEERLTRMEALRTYTMNNAFAAFEENDKGSLVKGKLADITILSKNILTVPDEEIQQARVMFTIVGGKVQYESAKTVTTSALR